MKPQKFPPDAGDVNAGPQPDDCASDKHTLQDTMNLATYDQAKDEDLDGLDFDEEECLTPILENPIIDIRLPETTLSTTNHQSPVSKNPSNEVGQSPIKCASKKFSL